MTVAQQRVEGQGLHSRLPGTDRCQNCHIEHKGSEASITTLAYQNVHHDELSGYSLASHGQDYDGNPMDCDSCHQQKGYAAASLDCISCHVEEDHDYMSEHIELFGNSCISCHDGADRMMAFKHDEVYKLEDKHAEADCADCHTGQVFEAAARDCIDCHEDPEIHDGKFGRDCSRCHTAVAWTPAYLIRHNFYLDHGSDQNHDCETCHLANYTDQTCYNCHEHTQTNMQEVHLAEHISEYQECAQCHPTGISGEAARLLELDGIPQAEAHKDGVSLEPAVKPGEQELKDQNGSQVEGKPGDLIQKDVSSLPENGNK
jgi:hypothetical protein